jgi:hypothetical protein
MEMQKSNELINLFNHRLYFPMSIDITYLEFFLHKPSYQRGMIADSKPKFIDQNEFSNNIRKVTILKHGEEYVRIIHFFDFQKIVWTNYEKDQKKKKYTLNE